MKRIGKITALITILSLVFQMVVLAAKYPDIGDDSGSMAHSSSDPFSLMYDSDQKLIEAIENMVICKDIPDYKEDNIATKNSGIASVYSEDAAASSVDDKEISDEIKSLIQSGAVDAIDDLNISDELKSQIHSINEQLKEDRFIIKYSAESDVNISTLIKEHDTGTNVNIVSINEKELVILEEKVNPREIADMLKAEGAEKYIEYIQPDFLMEYATKDDVGSLELTVNTSPEVLPDPSPEATLVVLPEQEIDSGGEYEGVLTLGIL